LLDASEPIAGVIVALPTPVIADAVVLKAGDPVTPDVNSVSLPAYPEIVAVNAGFASPYTFVLASAVTVKAFGVTVADPLAPVSV
jgi:hypothetical protein